VPAKVGPHALNDASGRYFGQSLSGYGIMWNSDYLRQRQIREPQEWQDLAQPAYAGHVVLSAPSRSGTTHLMVESMLQGLGWEQGWALLLQLAGNAAEISPDSYAVPRGIARGSYGAGLVIDAFGLAAKYSGMPVDFAYATMAPVLPASIGLVAGAHNPDGPSASWPSPCRRRGSSCCWTPDQPPAGAAGRGAAHACGLPDPYLQAQRSRLQFDVELSSTRYQLVSRLFDLVVTEPLVELQAATRAIHAADRALRSRSSRQGAALLASARKVAYTPVLPAMEASSRQWLAAAGARLMPSGSGCRPSGARRHATTGVRASSRSRPWHRPWHRPRLPLKPSRGTDSARFVCNRAASSLHLNTIVKSRKASMQHVELGRSGLKVSPICLGTMTFGEQVNEADAHRILSRALERGVYFWDTAEMYAVPAREATYGATETILGNWFKANPGQRDKVVLASKVAGPRAACPGSAKARA
jgi:hypothetical protein